MAQYAEQYESWKFIPLTPACGKADAEAGMRCEISNYGSLMRIQVCSTGVQKPPLHHQCSSLTGRAQQHLLP